MVEGFGGGLSEFKSLSVPSRAKITFKKGNMGNTSKFLLLMPYQ